jgi:hypothetical protein
MANAVDVYDRLFNELQVLGCGVIEMHPARYDVQGQLWRAQFEMAIAVAAFHPETATSAGPCIDIA